MQKYFHYIWSLATKRDRAKLILVIVATILIPFFELFGIGAVFSFIAIVTDPEIINSSEWAARIKEIFSIEGEPSYLWACSFRGFYSSESFHGILYVAQSLVWR